MAITESELNISNQSYTNKDFDAVYTELLTLAKKISYKYDPTASNESDPFIILLKLLAFVTDKVNYQIDKNILERFMPSATQESSVRDLTSRLGYNMHYYIGSETQVVYKYKFPTGWTGGDITVPAFTSTIKSSIDDSIIFIPTADGRIDSGTGTSAAVSVIQGTYKKLSVLDSSTIQLENLDANNRIYFPETMVAQNGVFITGGSISELFATSWKRTENLNSEQYGSPCYFFGFDSNRALPYIQFPDWISVVIGSGLTINYVVTLGSYGNVRARSLDQVSFTVEDSSGYSASDIIVVNTNAATSGKDPESIDDAYNGFKKTIGTFDTLVTCRDYANAIYNLLDDSGNHYVSNVQVADRRSDINYSLNMVGFNGSQTTESKVSNSVITPYDICLYPFKPVSMSTVTAVSSIEAYRESFKRLADTSDTTPVKTIKNKIEDLKTLVHTYKDFASTDIFAIKNYYELNAIISTVQKVDALEQASILTNVNGALATNFYSRNVDFGYEIPYDELLKCIENADTRIKSVSLFEPELTPKAALCDVDGTEVGISNDAGTAVSDWFRVVAIKNIVSGRVALFNYDSSFVYAYDKNRDSSDNFDIIKTAEWITTEANIGNASETVGQLTVYYIAPNTSYTLAANEAAQFIAPSYIDYQIYPYGINYYLKLDNDTSGANSMSITSWTGGYVNVKFTNPSGSSTASIKAYQLTAGTVSVQAGNDYTSFLRAANDSYCFTVLPEASGSTYVYDYPTGNNNYIAKNSEYQLTGNDELIFEYTEDDVDKFDVFTKDTVIDGKLVNVIKPNFDMYTTRFRQSARAAYPSGESGNSYTNPADGVSHTYHMLSTNQEIATRQLNVDTIDQPRKFYWRTQNSNNTIDWVPIYTGSTVTSYEYILKESEEIFYTDMNMTALQEFGSGTRIEIKLPLKEVFSQSCEIIQDLSTLVVDGLEAFKNYFKTINASSTDTIKIEEQQIITLTEGDVIKNTSTSTSDKLYIKNNAFDAVNRNIIQYKFETDEDFSSLPDLSTQGVNWRARALLDINAGPSLIQTLENHQSITVKFKDVTDPETYPSSPNSTWSFQFDSLCQVYGGQNIPLTILDIYYNVSYPLIYVYKLDADTKNNISISEEDKYCRAIFDTATIASPKLVTIHLPQILLTGSTTVAKDVYVMCHVNGLSDTNTLKVKYTRNSSYTAGTELFTPYNIKQLTQVTEGEAAVDYTYYMPSGMTILKTNGIKDLTFTANSSDIVLVLSFPRVADNSASDTVNPNAINPFIGLLSSDLSVSSTDNPKKLTTFELALRAYCGYVDGETYDPGNFKDFYATCWLDTNKELELSKTCKLSDAQAFYDVNNIANKWAIPEIDFSLDGSSITIARSSQK